MRKILMALVLGSALLAGQTALSNTEKETITARDLRQAFTDNSSAAEARFMGKTVLIQGIVLSTGMSKYMTPNVLLSDRAGGDVHVICVLPRVDTGKLSDFKTDQNVTMSGRVYRQTDRGIVVKECAAAG